MKKCIKEKPKQRKKKRYQIHGRQLNNPYSGYKQTGSTQKMKNLIKEREEYRRKSS